MPSNIPSSSRAAPEGDATNGSETPVNLTLPERALSESDKKELSNIWKFLKRPQDIDDNDIWPFLLIEDFKEFLVPPTPPSAGVIPDCFIPFLKFDFRNYPTFGERSDHVAWSVDAEAVKNMSPFWQNVLFRILVTWTNFQQPKTRGSDKVRCIIHNLDGYDAYNDSNMSKGTPTFTEVTPSLSKKNENPCDTVYQPKSQPTSQGPKPSHFSDVNQSIRVITSLFGNDKIKGEETEPFIHQLQPILDQMEISHIPAHHRVSALFSILSGKARTVASKFNITQMSITDFAEALKKELCLDPNIRERKKHRWNSLTYAFFRNKVQSEDEATRNCIDHIKAHQKDLPPYLLNDEALLERLRGIFKQQIWCQSLFERSSVGMSAASFEELLKTAASNADERRTASAATNPPSFSVSNQDACHSHHHDHSHIAPDNINNLVAAFFARTPPPPRHRRPFRFRNNQSFKRHPSRTPYALRRFRSRYRKPNQCFGCLQEGHILKNCPERQKYTKRFQFIRDLGTAAAMIVDNMEKEPDDELLEIATFFLENDCFEDNDFDEFNVWLSELLDACDASPLHVNNISTTPPAQSNPHFDPYRIQESIPQIQEAMYDLSIHSVFAIVKHLLMDTGSPKNLTPEPWLKQAEWTPVKTIKLPVNMKPFRFAGQYVHAIYAACLTAVITDINGKQYLFRQIAFILPDIPIPFLVGLQTQRSLSFDICLRKGQGSHVRINKMNSTFPLYLQSHVWLQFQPCTQDPDIHFDWTPLIKEAFDFNPKSTNYACPVNPPRSTMDEPVLTQELLTKAPSTTPVTPELAMCTFMVNTPKPKPVQPFTLCYSTPPWKRDDWKSKTTPENARRLHQSLRHPTPTALLNLYRQQNEGRKLPREVIKSIENIKCRPCAEHAQLPRRPKLAMPQPATPNISVTLDVMPHNVSHAKLNILVMLDAGDMMLKLANLQDDSARTAFNAYLSRWIAIFDAPVFTIVDRGTNLTNNHMASSLREVDSTVKS